MSLKKQYSGYKGFKESGLKTSAKQQEYSVLGVSGSRPYAVACAYAYLPKQLKGVALVCGIGPYDISLRDISL